MNNNNDLNLFQLCDKRFIIDGKALRLYRINTLDVTIEKFAYVCNWSTSYQWKLENNKISSVCDETRRRINAAIEVLSA